MKRRLIPFLVLLVLFLLCGLYTGGRLFYALVFSMVIALCVAVCCALYSIFRFKYLQTLEPAIVKKGDIVKLNIDLVNERSWPFCDFTVLYDTLDSLSGGERPDCSLALAPHETVSIAADMECRYRGQYVVGLKRMIAADPMGLIRIDYDLTKTSYYKPCNLVVYPRVIELESLPFPMLESEGAAAQAQKATDELSSPTDTRAYQFGDPLKTIHWKLSARRGELITKQYDVPMRPHTLLYIDTGKHGLEGGDAVVAEDLLCESAAAIVNCVLRSNLPLEMVWTTSIRESLEGVSLQNFDEFHTALAYMKFNSNIRVSALLRDEQHLLSRSGSIMLITAKMDSELLQTLLHLAGNGISATVFLITLNPDADSDEARALAELRRRGVRGVTFSPQEDLRQKVGELI